jgi:uncharacterized membrane protein YfcA
VEISAAIIIAIVVLLIGISKSAFAGALGVFAVPLLMLKFSAVEAIALMLPLLIIADVITVKGYWKKWDTPLLITLIPGAIVGIITANLIIDLINNDYLQFVIASICIIFAIKNIVFKHIELKLINNKVGAYCMSALSGISSTLVHAGGPPLLIYFSAIGLAPSKFVATAAIFFAIMNLVKLVGFVSLGLITPDLILTALAFIPMAFVGHWIGVKINNNLDKQLFLKVMNYLLLVLGFWLIIKANIDI